MCAADVPRWQGTDGERDLGAWGFVSHRDVDARRRRSVRELLFPCVRRPRERGGGLSCCCARGPALASSPADRHVQRRFFVCSAVSRALIAMSTEPSDPFARHEDGSAVDPAAYKAALLEDPRRVQLIVDDLEMSRVVRGDDVEAFQELLRAAYEEEQKYAKARRERVGELTIDAQRCLCTVPRDTVQIYKQMHESGLQYGPAFRLLRNVHVPEATVPQSSAK
ncbi:unnamed protein product [Pedinophyceae sp. YPF-701]|nr:unnamed protein product [Pedinophyceae sp. YPF-701]